MILAGQCKGAGKEITFGCLHAAYVPFKVFSVSFEVFHHEVFASQLERKKTESQKDCMTLELNYMWLVLLKSLLRHARLMVPHLIMVAKVVYPHMFLHVGVIEILPEPAHITPVEVPLSITVEEKKSRRQIQATHMMTGRLMWRWPDNPTHSFTSTQPGLWRRTSCMVLIRPHL